WGGTQVVGDVHTLEVVTATVAVEYIYIIGAPEIRPVKIGRSIDPSRRISRLQTGSPFPLKVLWQHAGDVVLEIALHRELGSYRVHGEWFDFGERDAVAVVSEAVFRLDPTLAEVREKRAKAARDELKRRVNRLLKVHGLETDTKEDAHQAGTNHR